MRILITGGSGFIGNALIHQLKTRHFNVTAAVRNETHSLPSEVKQICIGDILPDTKWEIALSSVDVVIHLAARVHVMDDNSIDPLSEFRKVNTAGTLNLAQQASEAGVKRFVFLSSIKVNGEHTSSGNPFKAKDSIIPIDPYGLSKYEAEQGLQEIAKQTGLEIVIIRPPLVYGPGVKANFLNMIKWVNKSIPLPFGNINNQRSLVALDNLIDLIIICITHPAAENQTFLVSDDKDLSTTELLIFIAQSLKKPSRLIPIPSNYISLLATIIGKRSIAQRICGSLQVDISHTKKTLNWKPPITVDEAIKKTTEAYLNEKIN